MVGQRQGWWLVVGAIVLAAGAWWWLWPDDQDIVLEGAFLRSFESAADDGRYVLWINQPGEVVEQFERLFGESRGAGTQSSGGPLIPARARQLLPKAKEALIQLDSERRVMVEVRVSAGWAVLAKALGIVRSDPWLGGGQVGFSDEQGLVRWRKSGRFAANLWRLAQIGFEHAPAVPTSADPVLAASALLNLPGEDGQEHWVLDTTRADGVLQVSRLDARSSQYPRERVPNLVAPWWQVAGDGSGAASGRGSVDVSEVLHSLSNPLVLAVNRSGENWQALLWLDSPVSIDGRSVSLEIPRAALLKSSAALAWKLPAERVARTLNADISKSRSPGGAVISALSPLALQELVVHEAALREWAMALPSESTALWVDPAALTVWFEALARMQETLPVPSTARSGGLGALTEALRQSAPLGDLMEEQGPLWIQSSENAILMQSDSGAATFVGFAFDMFPTPP